MSTKRLHLPRDAEGSKLWTPSAKVEVHNHFLLELFNAKTGRKLIEAEAENVVTNSGRTVLADDGYSGIGWQGGCAVGSGTNAPSPTDVTMLGNLKAVAGIATAAQVEENVNFSASPNNWWRRQKFYFPELVANYSLTEVGLFRGSTQQTTNGPGGSGNTTTLLSVSTPLHTRALFRDANGDPIAVTKNNTQIMVVTATVYFQRGGVDSGMALVDNYFAARAANNSSSGDVTYGGWRLGTGTAEPSNSDTNLSGTQLAAKSGFLTSNTKNRVFWTAGGWYYPNVTVPGQFRPPEKPYTTTYAMDWDLNEGNVTFSEVLVTVSGSGGGSPPNDTMAHIRFPCGNVGSSSVTKDNSQKLRQYMEIIW